MRATNTYIYNNIVYKGSAVTSYYFHGIFPVNGLNTNCYIYNNTLVGFSEVANGFGGGQTPEANTNVVWRNNLFYNSILFTPAAGTSQTHSDYNLFYNSGAMSTNNLWGWGNTNYSNLATYRSASGQDAHSLVANPLLTNRAAYDFTLQAGSPAIGAGIGPSADPLVPTTDINGVARTGATTDIGAYEYSGTTPPPPPTPPPDRLDHLSGRRRDRLGHLGRPGRHGL